MEGINDDYASARPARRKNHGKRQPQADQHRQISPSRYIELQSEVIHYQERLLHQEASQKLEVSRLLKEIDYHKRLRQGAEQRALQLEERLAAQQRHTAGFDEAQSGLIQQSQLLISRNAELTHRLKTVEASVEQLQSLKLCLEAELAQVYSDRDRLAAQVHQVLLSKHAHQAMSWADMAEEEEEEEVVEEEASVTGLAEALAPVSVGELPSPDPRGHDDEQLPPP
ncbi:hypothetical protein V8C86DRAFT_2472851 [Haematococcus lacustris]